MIDARQRLIVALDLPDIAAARTLVQSLEGAAVFYKIGLTLQLAPGVEDFVRELIDSGRRVFLDYKYYDIPETVRKAVERAARLGVSFLTVHGAAGTIRGAVAGRGSADLKLMTVTVLTSMEAADIAEMGVAGRTVEELVLFRARMALEAGCDGVIASGHEARRIKSLTGGKLLVVTPGIRPGGYGPGDQKRAMTPGEAIGEGADYLVIGRPITEPEGMTPREAVERVVGEMQAAFGG